MRQMANILQFTSDIRYIEGHKNIVADALSRVNVNQIQTSSSNIESNPSSSSSSIIEELSIERIIDERVKKKME